MQTQLADFIKQTHQGKVADEILRSCVHCGFCTATCPTYQLLGDELDGPRGRIYQIKEVLEGQAATKRTRQHLDRCLTCRSCETTCPSGVRYGRLLEIGREVVEQQLERPLSERLVRWGLRSILPYPRRFSLLYKTGLLFRPLLPAHLKKKTPLIESRIRWNRARQQKKLLVLEGCAQSVLTPDTNAMASEIFSRLGYELIRVSQAGCCGAVSTHLSALEEGLDFMRRNIDAWWPHIDAGVDGILVTASGCGAMLQEYGDLLADDTGYAEKARQVSTLVRDPSELLLSVGPGELPIDEKNKSLKIAFHSPCTLQHGMKLQGVVEGILQKLGFTLVNVSDSHLCCGSAGTYSILQPEISQQLLDNKLDALNAEKPDIIVTANIGCQLHLQSQADVPVRHWLSLLM